VVSIRLRLHIVHAPPGVVSRLINDDDEWREFIEREWPRPALLRTELPPYRSLDEVPEPFRSQVVAELEQLRKRFEGE